MSQTTTTSQPLSWWQTRLWNSVLKRKSNSSLQIAGKSSPLRMTGQLSERVSRIAIKCLALNATKVRAIWRFKDQLGLTQRTLISPCPNWLKIMTVTDWTFLLKTKLRWVNRLSRPTFWHSSMWRLTKLSTNTRIWTLCRKKTKVVTVLKFCKGLASSTLWSSLMSTVPTQVKGRVSLRWAALDQIVICLSSLQASMWRIV